MDISELKVGDTVLAELATPTWGVVQEVDHFAGEVWLAGDDGEEKFALAGDIVAIIPAGFERSKTLTV